MLIAGIIGAGYIGEAHAHGYAALDNVQLAFVVDNNTENAQRLSDRYQAQIVDSLEELVRLHPDLVSVCTPTPTHEVITNTLLNAGIHVLCEKPIARDLSQAQSMIEISTRTGSKLMIAHVSRYEVDHLKAKQILDRGDLGELRMAFHSITSPYPGWSTQNWLGDVNKSGGPVVDLAIHSVDYMLWLFQCPVERVYALGNPQPASKDHYVLVNLFFKNGGLGLVEASWAHPIKAPLNCRVELSGTSGRIAWDYERISALRTFSNSNGRQDYILDGEDSFRAEIASFVDCIENNRPSPIPGEQGREALKVCLAASNSLINGSCVEVTKE
jgi:predicted dehydrogenase